MLTQKQKAAIYDELTHDAQTRWPSIKRALGANANEWNDPHPLVALVHAFDALVDENKQYKLNEPSRFERLRRLL